MRTELATQNVANVAQLLRKPLRPEDALLETAREEGRAKIQELGGQGLSNIAWALGTLLLHGLLPTEPLSVTPMLRPCGHCTQQPSNARWAPSKLLHTGVLAMDSA
mmetsp:Transcript_22454/g.72712  ORF Transcript_22454/g.72712 Transcript_22454/m.72712 type:complete len:106 (+) Transcript_22454:140-457(+)